MEISNRMVLGLVQNTKFGAKGSVACRCCLSANVVHVVLGMAVTKNSPLYTAYVVSRMLVFNSSLPGVVVVQISYLLFRKC